LKTAPQGARERLDRDVHIPFVDGNLPQERRETQIPLFPPLSSVLSSSLFFAAKAGVISRQRVIASLWLLIAEMDIQFKGDRSDRQN